MVSADGFFPGVSGQRSTALGSQGSGNMSKDGSSACSTNEDVTGAGPVDWDLTQFFPSGSVNIESDLKLLQKKFGEFAQKRSLLTGGQGLTNEEFLGLLRDLEEIEVLASYLGGYASLSFAQDTSDQKAQSLLAKIDAVLTEANNSVMFFTLWWKKLPEEEAGPLLEAAPNYSYMLTRTRAFREHTLSESEEKIINLKDLNGREIIVRLYDIATNGYTFNSPFLPENEQRPLNREELMVYARSHLPEYRAGAYQELYRVYGKEGPFLGQIYQGLTKDWRSEEVDLRHHATPQAARNKINDLSDQTVASLLRVCRQRAPEIFGRYFKLKAKRLGLDKLRRYDIYAPLRPLEKTYTFSEALTEVEKAFRAFDDEFADLALKIPSSKRLSSVLRPFKQGGAFCASNVPGEVPWVLMNFVGQQHDLFTLAHELGHGVHSQLASAHNIFEFHSSLPLAETASTFGEILLTKRFHEIGSTEEKENLDFSFLDDAYATVGRQAFFSIFEVEAHEMIFHGATPDELAEAYLKNLEEQFGEAVQVSDEFRWEWVSIPHFYHVPFYVYAYSFGQLLVYSLWNLYQKEGASFVPRLKTILSKGGSASPESILAQAGLGPLDDDFWHGGFEVIESFIPK
ncbi:MAG: M3 family oligoendopeptidase [Deltaproteobacteria bacterium]|jgi:oligoendopeptidase F|nr:M3 family oligoendopeptidase [Deltaproteobacteria bacterium]